MRCRGHFLQPTTGPPSQTSYPPPATMVSRGLRKTPLLGRKGRQNVFFCSAAMVCAPLRVQSWYLKSQSTPENWYNIVYPFSRVLLRVQVQAFRSPIPSPCTWAVCPVGFLGERLLLILVGLFSIDFSFQDVSLQSTPKENLKRSGYAPWMA